MRAVGLDIGAARVGVAVSDASGAIASPCAVLDARRLAADVGPLRRILEDHEAEVVVVGLPLTLAGEEGPQAAEVRRVADRLARLLPVPFEFHDERLSTETARRALAEAGVSDRDKRGVVDKVAAAVILQGWLDARRTDTGDDA